MSAGVDYFQLSSLPAVMHQAHLSKNGLWIAREKHISRHSVITLCIQPHRLALSDLSAPPVSPQSGKKWGMKCELNLGNTYLFTVIAMKGELVPDSLIFHTAEPCFVILDWMPATATGAGTVDPICTCSPLERRFIS